MRVLRTILILLLIVLRPVLFAVLWPIAAVVRFVTFGSPLVLFFLVMILLHTSDPAQRSFAWSLIATMAGFALASAGLTTLRRKLREDPTCSELQTSARLDADVVSAGGNRHLDARIEQLFEDREEHVLQADPECQDTVEELRDRRQLLAKRAVLVQEIEAGRVLEFRKRTALDLAGIKELVELPERRPGIGALEIVLGAEQALAAGLTLAAGDHAERDRCGELLQPLGLLGTARVRRQPLGKPGKHLQHRRWRVRAGGRASPHRACAGTAPAPLPAPRRHPSRPRRPRHRRS